MKTRTNFRGGGRGGGRYYCSCSHGGDRYGVEKGGHAPLLCTRAFQTGNVNAGKGELKASGVCHLRGEGKPKQSTRVAVTHTTLFIISTAQPHHVRQNITHLGGGVGGGLVASPQLDTHGRINPLPPPAPHTSAVTQRLLATLAVVHKAAGLTHNVILFPEMSIVMHWHSGGAQDSGAPELSF